MISRDKLHAMAYADNLTRIHMLKRFRKKIPGLFVHAVLETRRADPSRDYYAPPSIADTCVAVEKLAWDSTGCDMVACFPYKSFEERCVSGEDAMRWVRVDDARYALACQPSCDRGMTLDTRYRRGDCFVSNAAKRLYVMHPERYNGAVAKHARLTLDGETGRLALNEAYCKAYGIKWDADSRDCYLPKRQEIAELFVGSTVFRRKLISKNYLPREKTPPPPPAPYDEAESRERAWERVHLAEEDLDFEKTAATDPSTTLEGDFGERDRGDSNAEDLEKLAEWLAKELAVEFGVHAAARQVRNYVTRKMSAGLASQVLADAGLKRSLFHGALKTVAPSRAIGGTMATRLTAAGGKTASLVAVKGSLALSSLALGVFGAVSFLTDVFDPFEYGRVMDKKRVDELDRLLDLRYFGTDAFENVRLSPEDVWEMLADDSDARSELAHYKRRYDDYISALRNHGSVRLEKIDLTESVGAKKDERSVSSAATWLFWTVVGASFAATAVYFVRYTDALSTFLCALLLLRIYLSK